MAIEQQLYCRIFRWERLSQQDNMGPQIKIYGFEKYTGQTCMGLPVPVYTKDDLRPEDIIFDDEEKEENEKFI